MNWKTLCAIALFWMACLALPFMLCEYLATDKPLPGLPECRDIADDPATWKTTIRCTMESEQWLCVNGRCERIPGAP